MRMYDIIHKKRDGELLTQQEIEYVINGFTDGSVPDYQMAALAMAIFLKGMTPEETAHMTMAMARSGDMVDLSAIKGVTVDKHSTGGVGDTTTLVLLPLVASVGVPVAKHGNRSVSSRSGSADVLEALGVKIDLPPEKVEKCLFETG
ncbi:MAG: pyrimidine-nucleoside phosphorylase, partial [Tumebacillaceae bacterium]